MFISQVGKVEESLTIQKMLLSSDERLADFSLPAAAAAAAAVV